MITAGRYFTHAILSGDQLQKRKQFNLVTSGIYSFSRHPGYFGWFLWSIGTQILLSNPISFIAYGIISWFFFYKRIREEEKSLIANYGKEYIEYKSKVPTRIPFIP